MHNRKLQIIKEIYFSHIQDVSCLKGQFRLVLIFQKRPKFLLSCCSTIYTFCCQGLTLWSQMVTDVSAIIFASQPTGWKKATEYTTFCYAHFLQFSHNTLAYISLVQSWWHLITKETVVCDFYPIWPSMKLKIKILLLW